MQRWMYVEPEHVPEVWVQVAPSIRRGLRVSCGDTLTEEKLLEGLAEGRWQLWVRAEEYGNLSGSIILSLVRRQKGLAIDVLMLGGKWWNDSLAMDALQAYARKIGAYTIEGIARNALVDTLKACGWRQKAVVMDLEVKDEREERRTSGNDADSRGHHRLNHDADTAGLGN